MLQHLVLTALSSDQQFAVASLMKLADHAGCNITHCHMSNYGQTFACIIMLSGTWDTLAKLENGLQSLSKKSDLKLIIRRTSHRYHSEDHLPYSIQISALDIPGVLHKLTRFLHEQDVIIDEISCDTFVTTTTATQMGTINITIAIPASCHIATVRENILSMCDDNNLDAIMEPIKA